MATTIDEPNSDENDLPFDLADATDIPLPKKLVHKEMQFTKEDIYSEKDLVIRAKMIKKSDSITWPHRKPPNPRVPEITAPITESAINRYKAFDYLFDYGRGYYPNVTFPYYDIFKGKLVDHNGELFGLDTPMRKIVEAINAVGLDNPTEGQVESSLRMWAKDHKIDSLALFFNSNMPEWDGVSRLETKLIDLFKPHDTPLTRLIGKYFWLSLYNRINEPGSAAPITIALIGSQDVGKSYFSLLLTRILTGDPKGGVVELDLSAKTYTQFLRDITGRSLIANVGEMIGFNKGDMIRIKSFITRTEDEFDFKFMDSKVKPRQWITIMDGNGYDGLQRDDTGNRRFYPIFAFQGPDKNGQPTWEDGKKADFTNFAEDVWQIMAECRVWMEENSYRELVAKANTELKEFSIEEMKEARGVVKDDNFGVHLKNILIRCDWIYFRPYGGHNGGFRVESQDIINMFRKGPQLVINNKTLSALMKAMGFEENPSIPRGYRIYNTTMDMKASAEDMTVENVKQYIYLYGLEEEYIPTKAELKAKIKEIEGSSSGGGF